MPEPRKLRVFLCHSSQDKPIVRELYQRLLAEGWIDPWLDEEKLLPGQDWDMEIEKAVEAADAVIVCLSNKSVTKEGYIQRELKYVLDIALEKPEETIFIVPLRLDDVQPPRRLRSWQYVDYFPKTRKKWAYDRITESLKSRNNSLGLFSQSLLSTKIPDSEIQTAVNSESQNLNISFSFSKENIRIGIWGPENSGKTVYMLSLYISGMQNGSDWLVGFNEKTSLSRRKNLVGDADSLRRGIWPSPTVQSSSPDLYGFEFYPSPDRPIRKIRKTETDPLLAFWKFFTEEPLKDKRKRGVQISLSDVSGSSYLNESPDNPLWQHLAGCQAIICLLDPSDIKSQFRITNNLVEFLYEMVKRKRPEAIIQGRYLPHYISVCFTKMDRPEWRSMIDFPETVVDKITNMTDINIRRLLTVRFSPERIKFYCVSSVGLEFPVTGRINPINIFNPLNDWMER